jgi:glycosyltransferase involved in cell wall biosynthesis
MEQVDLSIIVPAFNEANCIEQSLVNLDNFARNRKCNYEIVVVDDGSNDSTLSKAACYANKNIHVKVYSYNRNNGKGFAIKKGFSESIGDIAVFADSDLEIDLSLVSTYVAALDKCDIVIASKWHPDSHVEISLLRRTLSHGYNVLVKLLIGINIRDTQAGLKVINKKAFEKIIPHIKVNRFAFDVELLAMANIYRLKIIEMPVQLRLNKAPKPKEILKMFTDLLDIAIRVKMLRIRK